MIEYSPEYLKKVLSKAQQLYGFNNQIMVAIEELNELAAVLAKYPRYPNHEAAQTNLHDKVLDELADVFIVMNHVMMIFNFNSYELFQAIDNKMLRLERWLNTPDSTMYTTTIDRAVGGCESKNLTS